MGKRTDNSGIVKSIHFLHKYRELSKLGSLVDLSTLDLEPVERASEYPFLSEMDFLMFFNLYADKFSSYYCLNTEFLCGKHSNYFRILYVLNGIGSNLLALGAKDTLSLARFNFVSGASIASSSQLNLFSSSFSFPFDPSINLQDSGDELSHYLAFRGAGLTNLHGYRLFRTFQAYRTLSDSALLRRDYPIRSIFGSPYFLSYGYATLSAVGLIVAVFFVLVFIAGYPPDYGYVSEVIPLKHRGNPLEDNYGNYHYIQPVLAQIGVIGRGLSHFVYSINDAYQSSATWWAFLGLVSKVFWNEYIFRIKLQVFKWRKRIYLWNHPKAPKKKKRAVLDKVKVFKSKSTVFPVRSGLPFHNSLDEKEQFLNTWTFRFPRNPRP